MYQLCMNKIDVGTLRTCSTKGIHPVEVEWCLPVNGCTSSSRNWRPSGRWSFRLLGCIPLILVYIDQGSGRRLNRACVGGMGYEGHVRGCIDIRQVLGIAAGHGPWPLQTIAFIWMGLALHQRQVDLTMQACTCRRRIEVLRWRLLRRCCLGARWCDLRFATSVELDVNERFDGFLDFLFFSSFFSSSPHNIPLLLSLPSNRENSPVYSIEQRNFPLRRKKKATSPLGLWKGSLMYGG